MAPALRMHICHASIKHPPFDTRIFMRQCRSLAKAEWLVTWCVPNPPTGEHDGVQLRALPTWVPIVRHPVAALRVLRQTIGALHRIDADVYVLHDPELLPVALLLKRAGNRVVFDAHEHYRSYLPHRGKWPRWVRFLFTQIYLLVEAVAKRRLDGFFAATEYVATEYPPDRTLVLHNYPPAALAQTGDDSLAAYLPENRTLIYTGGWMSFRGIEQILAALERVRTPNVRLVVCSPRESNSRIRDLLHASPVADRIEDAGQLPHADMVARLRTAAIGLVLNQPVRGYDKAHANKLFEYMAVGLPVIASDFPLWREFVEGSGAGVVCDPTDPDAIAAAIDGILALSPEERRRYGEAGRRAVIERYSWDADVPPMLAFLERIAKQAPR